MAYKRKYRKYKKSYKRSSRWSKKSGKYSRKTWKGRKWTKRPMKIRKVTIPRLARFNDNMKIKLQFTYRNAAFNCGPLGPTGNQYYMNYAFIRAENPNDPGGSLSGRNAQFWNTLKNNYDAFTCLYSTARVKWNPTSPAPQSGWCYLMPIRDADLVGTYLTSSSVPPVPIDTVKEAPYVHLKNYVAGYGNNVSLKFKHRMSGPKLFGTPYDPSQDDQGVFSVTTTPKTWYWLFVWVSETASEFSGIVDFTVTYYVTLKQLTVPSTYDS